MSKLFQYVREVCSDQAAVTGEPNPFKWNDLEIRQKQSIENVIEYQTMDE